MYIYNIKREFCVICCALACLQRVLKAFLGPGYLHSEDEVV